MPLDALIDALECESRESQTQPTQTPPEDEGPSQARGRHRLTLLVVTVLDYLDDESLDCSPSPPATNMRPSAYTPAAAGVATGRVSSNNSAAEVAGMGYPASRKRVYKRRPGVCKGGCGKSFSRNTGLLRHWASQPNCERSHARVIENTPEEYEYEILVAKRALRELKKRKE